MILKCNNKECQNHNINISYSTVNVVVRNDEVEYCDKNKVQYTCDKCNIPLIEVKGENFKGFGAFHCAFSGKTSAEKIEILKNRERQHYKGDKNAQEQKKAYDHGEI